MEPDKQKDIGFESGSKNEIGGLGQEPIEEVNFGRIGAQAAKQVILQKIREAEENNY